MASSDKKRAANRANAQRSTGPRTAAGKRRSARNAVVHGLTARSAVLHGDDEGEFNSLARRTFDELDPVGPIEEQLVAEIINHTWKLRRVPTAEVLLFDEHHRQAQPAPDAAGHVEEVRRFLNLSMTINPVPKVEPTPAQSLCQMVEAKASGSQIPSSPVWSLERYAGRIERARGAALRMLLSLQKRRLAREEEDEDAEQAEEVSDGDEVSDAAAADVRTAADAAVVDPAPHAASLEGPPVIAPTPVVPPLAVSQTEARAEIAHRSAKPQAAVESSLDRSMLVEIAGRNSNLRNEPIEELPNGKSEVDVFNGDAINESSGFASSGPGSEPTAQVLPDMTTPVERSLPIGESPPPTT
jgi:hypothetical protein